jgi:hypothetical protein
MTATDGSGRLVPFGDLSSDCMITKSTRSVVSCCTGNGCNAPPPAIRCYTTDSGDGQQSDPIYQSCAILSSGEGTVRKGDFQAHCGTFSATDALVKCCTTDGCNALGGGSICTMDRECRGGRCVSGRCACSASVKCIGGLSCDLASQTCTKECRSDMQCTEGARTRCNTLTGQCVAPCTTNTCGNGRTCSNGVCITSCTADAQCDKNQICHGAKCLNGQCMTDDRCLARIATNASPTVQGKTVCDTATRTCVSPLISCFSTRTRTETPQKYRVCLLVAVKSMNGETVVDLRPGVFGAERISDCGRATRLLGLQAKCCAGENMCNLNLSW